MIAFPFWPRIFTKTLDPDEVLPQLYTAVSDVLLLVVTLVVGSEEPVFSQYAKLQDPKFWSAVTVYCSLLFSVNVAGVNPNPTWLPWQS